MSEYDRSRDESYCIHDGFDIMLNTTKGFHIAQVCGRAPLCRDSIDSTSYLQVILSSLQRSLRRGDAAVSPFCPSVRHLA